LSATDAADGGGEKAGARHAVWADYITRLEQANVANSLDNLKTFRGCAS
jgi:hypothetical protein